MQMKNSSKTGFAPELKIIPTWAWTLAGIIFIGAQVAFDVLLPYYEPDAPPRWFVAPMAILVGTLAACLPLLIGYINVDAGRRGMSRTLWTLLAIFIPNAIGVILYFLLRRPLSSLCPSCGAAIRPGCGYCPKCGKNLSLHCSHCQHAVSADDVYCSNCGNVLASAESAQPSQPQAS